MKFERKWVCVLLVLAMCLGLCACNATEKPETIDGGYMPNISMWTYEEYQTFIETVVGPAEEYPYKYHDDLPDNFVYYEDISDLGDFDALIMPCAYDYSAYIYSISDPYVGEFLVYIYHEPREEVQLPEITDVNMNDLRTVEMTTGVCVFRCGSLIYTYRYGKLTSIRWQAGSIIFVISNENSFTNVPVDEDTALSRLMKAETAEAVVAAIVEKEVFR